MIRKNRLVIFLLIYSLILWSVGCGTTTSSTDNTEDSLPTSTTTPAIVDPITTPAVEPTEASTTEPTETPTTEPTETPTTEPTPTTSTPRTRIYKNTNFYYQMSIPYSSRINQEDNYNTFIISDAGVIFIHIDKLTVDESAESYFNSILEGENENTPYLISEPSSEITENDVIIGYEFDCSNVADSVDYIGKGIILKKASFGFFVAFTSLEADWEENKEINLECLESFSLPPIYTGSYTNSEPGISLVLPVNWSLIETGNKSTPVEIFNNTGNYVELFDISLMQCVNGKLTINTVEPGTTAEEYIENKSDGATQTPFTFANSAVGSEYVMSLFANDVTIAEFRYIALVIGNTVYYFEFMGVPNMDTLEDSVTELAGSLVVSSQ